tara:strand:+ start:2542 stop:3003 length:462 start_codon:yes stop_codon:yes gene_type:complete
MKVIRFLFKLFLAIASVLSSVLLGLYIYAQFSGPIGPIPGGELNGEIAISEPDWRALLPDGKFIEVQFGDKNGYSVTLDPHVIDEELYTWSRAPNRWSSLIGEDPQVVIRIDGVLYRAIALKVENVSLLARVNEDRAGEKKAVGISFHLRLDK